MRMSTPIGIGGKSPSKTNAEVRYASLRRRDAPSLHDNANIAFQLQETTLIYDTVLELQPKVGGGGGEGAAGGGGRSAAALRGVAL